MDSLFEPDEKLYRAVYPDAIFWKDNGDVSSAAFLSKRGGCSVDRADFRDDSDVVLNMRNRGFKGSIITVTVQDCRNIDAEVIYSPSRNNIYHSEILKDKEHEKLTAGQRKFLAKHAVIVSNDEVDNNERSCHS